MLSINLRCCVRSLLSFSRSRFVFQNHFSHNCAPAMSGSDFTAPSEDEQKFYQKAEDYWANVSSDVDGMLGGFAQLHTPDVNDSRKFLTDLRSKGLLMSTGRAIDCGCGIGRIAKHLLLPMFKVVDMVDVTEQFIDGSKKYLGQDDSRVGMKFTEGLQTFEPTENFYDVIWIQWVTGHLTDEHFMEFFRRCKTALRQGGVIVFKDNISGAGKPIFDAEDNSWTRPLTDVLDLFAKTGLEVVLSKKQTNFPKGMYEVRMIALK
ncbi:hypothetical protein L596_014823 [Steinernema carpocapsae]|uniref:Alpha N-terminal protein methyltransferase 1 n=1 Tax=Steinernema carpocapsae TaxID=34508 RepID=A0A4U5NDA4_STECR|nr:hypothetical protein L596_014823 [Steinernema carpocapsae]